MRNFFRALTTIAERKRILEAKEVFHYLEGGYEMTRLACEQVFAQYKHAVATTAVYPFMLAGHVQRVESGLGGGKS